MKMKLAALILLSVVVQVPAAMYQTQDSVVVEGDEKYENRVKRQSPLAFPFALPFYFQYPTLAAPSPVPAPAAADSNANRNCWTNDGKTGNCVSIRQCYPNVRLPELSNLETWVLGIRGTCNYVESNGRQVYGVCCSAFASSSSSSSSASAGASSTVSVMPTMPTIPNMPPMPMLPPLTGSTGFQQPAAWWLWALYPGNMPLLPGVSAPVPINPVPTRPTTTQKPPTAPVVEETEPTLPPTTAPPTTAAPTIPPTTPAPTTLAPTTAAPTNPPTTPAPTTAAPTTPAPTTAAPTTPAPTTAAPTPTSMSFDCGKGPLQPKYDFNNTSWERIVGGTNAVRGDWPFIVALLNNGRQFCGGSIIDETHILTAAHCVAHMSSWDIARLQVAVKMHTLKPIDPEAIRMKVKRITRHKGFDSRTLYNDIAIVTLDSPIKMQEGVSAVCLPEAGSTESYADKEAVVIGWGALKEGGKQPTSLQEVTIRILDNADCKKRYGNEAPGGIVDSFLCARYPGKDSCSGDSGGPLIVQDRPGDKWVQAGVVSWGIGCGQDPYPGVYTRVTHFMGWIENNLK